MLENKQLNAKIKNLEKRIGETGGALGYNPEFLKLQCELNERDKQIALYKQRVATLESNVQQLQSQQSAQTPSMPMNQEMGDLDQQLDNSFNQQQNDASFDGDNFDNMNNSMLGGVQEDIIQRGSIQDLETQLSLKQNDLNQLQQQNSTLMLQKVEMYESYLNEKKKVMDLGQKLAALNNQEATQARIADLERQHAATS